MQEKTSLVLVDKRGFFHGKGTVFWYNAPLLTDGAFSCLFKKIWLQDKQVRNNARGKRFTCSSWTACRGLPPAYRRSRRRSYAHRHRLRMTGPRQVLSQEYKSQSMRLRRSISTLRLLQNRQKARKLGLLQPLPLQIIMKKSYYFTPVLCNDSVWYWYITPGVKF